MDVLKANRDLRVRFECTAAMEQNAEEQALGEKVCHIAAEPVGCQMAWAGTTPSGVG